MTQRSQQVYKAPHTDVKDARHVLPAHDSAIIPDAQLARVLEPEILGQG